MGCVGDGGLGRLVGEMSAWVTVVVEGSAFLSFLLCGVRRAGVPVHLAEECLLVLSVSFIMVTDVAEHLLEYHDEYVSTAILSAF